MILIAVSALLVGLAFALVASAGLRAMARRRVAGRVSVLVGAPRLAPDTKGVSGAVTRLARTLGQRIERFLPAAWQARYETRIQQAQLPWTTAQVWGWKALGAALGAFLGLVVLDSGAGALLLGAGAFFLPDLSLRERAERRRQAVLRALPDTIDLLTLVVEAGVGFDAAVSRVVERGRPGPLRDGLTRYLQETRMGHARKDALKATAERIDLPDFTSFVTAVIQTEQMGAAMGPTLRAQAQALRSRRTQAVEKKAQEAPIKLLFPLMVFILPTVFLVLFGPIFLTYLRNF